MKKELIFWGIMLMFFSCIGQQNKETTHSTDTLQYDSSKSTTDFEEILDTMPEDETPIFGYRFVISGDFDGDGKEEKLIEHFISGLDNKETNKFYANITYGDLIYLTSQKEAYSFVLSDNKLIDTLHIISGMHFGLSYLKNEGDLNGDGTDEISYVVNLADYSNLNTWYIMTYRHGKWVYLYSFDIWDWQLPDLPETFNQYGLFGIENKLIVTNDTINKEIERELKAFKGLVRKIKTNKIEIICNNDGDLDTMIVNLKR